jgi:hypothetical protein
MYFIRLNSPEFIRQAPDISRSIASRLFFLPHSAPLKPRMLTGVRPYSILKPRMLTGVRPYSILKPRMLTGVRPYSIRARSCSSISPVA